MQTDGNRYRPGERHDVQRCRRGNFLRSRGSACFKLRRDICQVFGTKTHNILQEIYPEIPGKPHPAVL